MPQIVRLDVENFKSYGGRHTIGPFRTFSSVIGPNGSGKSNLMDAISFVLGVRTQQLRGSQLADLIYRKATRKSNDALPTYAFVELVYMHEEGEEEIKFRRTIVREGKNITSKYSVDGRTIRFREYKENLADIGVRVNAQNFLVFQNDVITVAQKSPQDLAKQIDVVSGSADLQDEYVKLRGEAEQAREAYAQIYERKRHIKKQQHDIRIQKEEAEHFESLLEKLNNQKQQYFLWTLYHLNTDLRRSHSAVEKLKEKIAASKGKLSQAEESTAIQSQENATLRKEAIKAEKALKKQANRVEEMRPEYIKIEEQIALLERNLRAEELKRNKLQKDFKKHQSAIKSLADRLEELRRTAESQPGDEMKELELAASEMQEYQELRQRADEESSAHLQEMERFRKQEVTSQQNLQQAKETLSLLAVREKELQDHISQRQDRQSQTQTSLDENQARVQDLRKQLNELVVSVENAESNRSELENKLSDINRRLRDANSDRRQSEKERKFLEILERLRQHFPGVHGRLVDMCKPVQQKYNLAVAVAIARDMDSIVVDEERVAVQCIEYLRKQRLGTATFLPLDTLVVHEPRESFRRIDSRFGDFKLVFDVVKCSPTVRKAVMYACGETLVTDSLKSAQRLCYDRSSRGEDGLGKYKVVVLDGSLIHRTGNMTGGEGTFSRNLRKWDDQELLQLTKQRDEIQGQLNQLKDLQQSIQVRQVVEQDILKFEHEALYIQDQLKASEEKLGKDHRQLEQIRTQMRENEVLVSQAQASQAQLSSQIEATKQNVDRTRQEVFGEFADRVGVENIEDYEENRMQAARKSMDDRLKQQQEINRLVNQLAYEEQRDLQSTLDTVSDKLDSDRGRLAQLIKDLQSSTKTLEKEEAKTRKLRDSIEELGKRQQEAQQAHRILKKKEAVLRRETEKTEGELTVNQGRVDQIADQQSQILRRCQLEQVVLPRSSEGSSNPRKRKGTKSASTRRQKRPRRGAAASSSSSSDEDAMQDDSGSESDSSLQEGNSVNGDSTAVDLDIDFSHLENTQEPETDQDYNQAETAYLNEIAQLTQQLESLNPNLRATDQFAKIQSRLRDENLTSEELKKRRDEAHQAFKVIQERRHKLFMQAFSHIKKQIGDIYRDLTRSAIYPTGGKAYILLDSSASGDKEDLATFEQGVQYNVMPSGKRYKDMDQLSGGEQTIAALALLFAIHSFSPAPFFVLDEVDAALDNTNVAKVAQFIKTRTRKHGLQCIVISLKDNFYTESDGLVGVFRDQAKESSGVLTLDLRPPPQSS